MSYIVNFHDTVFNISNAKYTNDVYIITISYIK